MDGRALDNLEKLWTQAARLSSVAVVPDAVRQTVAVRQNPRNRHWEYLVGAHPTWMRIDAAARRVAVQIKEFNETGTVGAFGCLAAPDS
jgi:hypothetical protein